MLVVLRKEFGVSQSPEGSTIDFHQSGRGICGCYSRFLVSIPRRVHHRFPQCAFRKTEDAPCLNPPKGPPSISTYGKGGRVVECLEPGVSIPRRVHHRFPQEVVAFKGETIPGLSQSPEGSTIDFHPRWHSSPRTPPMSQSPEGSTIDFHVETDGFQFFLYKKLSQSPEGSTIDFHKEMHTHHTTPLNEMSQSPEGSTIDFHSPPPSRAPSTKAQNSMSQSPEGSTIDFHRRR